MARFITLEGGDGSGKSTLLSKIEKDFETRGFKFLKTREPGGTPIAEEIREIILRKASAERPAMTAMTELLLYEAARADHVSRVIQPALDRGTHVLCDRFTYSSLAYQGVARQLGFELVRQLNTIATGGLEPDAVIWLKLDPEEGRRRTSQRGEETRLDAEKSDFHAAVYRAFEKLAHEEPGRFIVLNAALAPDEVYGQLVNHPLWKSLFGAAR